MAERVIVYIDGFNLYFGMREARYRRYYWLDVLSLSTNILKSQQTLVCAKYFTAKVSGSLPGATPTINQKMQGKSQRQAVFLTALEDIEGVEIFYGRYNTNKKAHCKGCNNTWHTPEEKMTDVQIATQLLMDAFEDRFDTAIIVSADSDLVPPVRAIKQLPKTKRLVACFPPKRNSDHLKHSCDGYFRLSRSSLAKSQLANPLQLSDGRILRRPPKWR